MKFNDKVYKVAAKIPFGRVSSYGEIAKVLNSKAYRAVGTAMNKNPYWPKVPCHRVVKSTGEIGGFAFGVKKKVELLKKECIFVKNGKIVDFEKKFFKL